MKLLLGLSVKKLLYEYFSVEDLKDALDDIGEVISGNKDELVNRLSTKWKSHDRDYYDLFDFLGPDVLQMICYHYSLDATKASHGTLKKRIRKAKLFESNSRKKIEKISENIPDKEIDTKKETDVKPFRDVNIKIDSIHISRGSKIGIAIGIVTAAATVIGVLLSLR